MCSGVVLSVLCAVNVLMVQAWKVRLCYSCTRNVEEKHSIRLRHLCITSTQN